MSKNTFLIKQQEVRITLSIGVIELDPMIELEHALEMVDRALYDAKFNGRNCVLPRVSVITFPTRLLVYNFLFSRRSAHHLY